MGRYWLVLGGTGSVKLGTAWYKAELGYYNAFMPVYIEKKVEIWLVTIAGRQTNEKVKIELLSQWTMDG